ncbi:MAG: hypothetical protein ACK4L7_09410 [Flavobacteriales bacterium]
MNTAGHAAGIEIDPKEAARGAAPGEAMGLQVVTDGPQEALPSLHDGHFAACGHGALATNVRGEQAPEPDAPGTLLFEAPRARPHVRSNAEGDGIAAACSGPHAPKTGPT